MTPTVVSNRFEDAVVIVTGSTSGIGFGIAKRFLEEGAAVVLNDEGTEDGPAAIDRLREDGFEATYVEADVSNPNACARLVDTAVDEYGSIDVLINNAAIYPALTSTETAVDEWEDVLDTDLRGPWLLSKYASEYMPPGGSIINIASVHADLTQVGLFPYNAAKAGLNGLTRAMALELAPEIRVNSINPGWIGVDRVLEEITAEYRDTLATIHPAGRIGKAEDIAGVAAFLASDDASFVIGETIDVSGGRSIVLQDDLLMDYTE